jgi:sensor histidine kinase YesM
MKYFLILLSFLLSGLSSFGNESLTKDQINQIVETHFLKDDLPVRYVSTILARIDGDATKSDSSIIQDLINKLDKEITIYEVCLVNTVTANLEIRISHKEEVNDHLPKIEVRKQDYQLIKNTVFINIPPGTNDMETKKIIHYYILRSLLTVQSTPDLHKKIPGSAFSEKKPTNITFSEIDYQILRNVYSKAYEKQLRNSKLTQYKSNASLSNKLQESRLAAILIGVLNLFISFLLLYLFLQKGSFNNHHFNFSSYFKQGLIIFSITAVYSLINAFFYIFRNATFFKHHNGFTAPVLQFTLFFSAIGLISIVLSFFSEKKILNGSNSLPLLVIFPFISTLIIPSFLVFLFAVLYPKEINPTQPLDSISLLIHSLYFLGIIAVLRALFTFLNKKSESIIHKKDVELAKLGELHKQAELQSLRSKINPHFLYNSLNSIASLALTDPKKTEQMALSLSDFYRYSINREQKQMNTISDELQAIKTYLEIEKVRFGDRLNFTITCPESMQTIEIPQLLIQPLVENAVKHGISGIVEKGEINITVYQENRSLKIRVADNGPEFSDGPLTGFGIRNTNERLDLLYGNKASINWENGKEKFIEITLPFKPAN